MNAEILCVGTEILLGDIINTNAAFISRKIAEYGVGCYMQTVVGDNPERLKAALISALERSDMVIMTGGLGPTYDDLTKETVAEIFGLEMELHQESYEQLVRLFKKFGSKMTPNNMKQAYMPKGAAVLYNDRGTANGVLVEHEGKVVILMPGPPREMTAMFEKQVIPYLEKKSDSVLVSHNLHFFGIGESALENMIKEYMEEHLNPTIAPYAKEGEVMLRVTAKAKSKREAEALILPVIEDIKKVAGEYIYGIDVDNLQNALVLSLKEKGLKAAFAESCTGGLVSKRVTEIPGASEVFGFSACTYSNGMKTKILGVKEETLKAYGAVSSQTAIEMARGVREVAGADIGVSVTGVAGPDGGTEEKPVGLVYIGISTKDGEDFKELKLSRGYGGEREFIRLLASSHALYMALKACKQDSGI